MIIGELYDRKMAEELARELGAQGIEVQIHEAHQMAPDQRTREIILQLLVIDPSKAQEAHEYFRVRMGLPGARPAPDPEWQKIHALRMGPVSKFLLGFSLAIYGVKILNPEGFLNLTQLLFINNPQREFLANISQGEVWRLITPIFLHFSFLHILFNGMWIKDLGAVFESEKGSRSFIFFVLVVSAISNFTQYLVMGPRFGGLSGLVYGLLGYLWVYGALHEKAKIKLPKKDVIIIVGWYFLCLTGMIGPIANVAHGVGLGLGMIWGLFPLRPQQATYKYIALAIFFGVGTYLIEWIKISN